jgi:hypothetical protein
MISEMNIGLPAPTSAIHDVNFRITPSGSGNASVCSHVKPLTAKASGSNFSEIGRSSP